MPAQLLEKAEASKLGVFSASIFERTSHCCDWFLWWHVVQALRILESFKMLLAGGKVESFEEGKPWTLHPTLPCQHTHTQTCKSPGIKH